MIDGSIHAGPNAVLSLKREGYHRTSFDLRDFADTMTYRRILATGGEARQIRTRRNASVLQQEGFCPQLAEADSRNPRRGSGPWRRQVYAPRLFALTAAWSMTS